MNDTVTAGPSPADPPAPDAARPVPSPGVPASREYAFTFSGNWKEYFRIWIVNLFLSIVTIGLYSPWAKVRKKRYFYGNTWVADSNFDYHGDPVAILKGRLVAVVALVAYNATEHYLPRLGWAVLFALMLLAPWLVTRSLRFNAVNSSYRNLRFHFHGGYREGLAAIAPLLAIPILAFLFPEPEPGQWPARGSHMAPYFIPPALLALAYPYLIGALKRFQVRRSAYGAAPFGFSARIRSFYRVYFFAGLLATVCMTAFGAAMFGLTMVPQIAWVAAPLAYLLAGAIVLAFTRSRIGNLAFNSTSLDSRVRFVSTLSTARLAWIYFGNLLAIVASVGLLVPWAVVRTAQYRASCLRVACEGDMEGILGDVAKPVGATGEELGEFFDVDLSL
jgi:uncharacterized membrane protein YjgN (DUF898 family)